VIRGSGFILADR